MSGGRSTSAEVECPGDSLLQLSLFVLSLFKMKMSGGRSTSAEVECPGDGLLQLK